MPVDAPPVGYNPAKTFISYGPREVGASGQPGDGSRIIYDPTNGNSGRFQVFAPQREGLPTVLIGIPDNMPISMGRVQDRTINQPYHAWLAQQAAQLNQSK